MSSPTVRRPGALAGLLVELMPFAAAWGVVFAVGFLLAARRDTDAGLRAGLAAGAHLANGQILAVVLSAAIGIVLHETAHGVLAAAMRNPVREVVIGVGPRVIRTRKLTVRLFPVAGQVRYVPGARGYAVVLLAGPLVNVALAVLFWRLTASGSWHEHRWALVGTQLWYVLITGFPSPPLIRGGEVNDATKALRWRRASPAVRERLARVRVPMSRADRAAAAVAADRALGDAQLRRQFLALVDAGEQAEARRFFAEHAARLGADRHLLVRLIPD